MTDQTRSGPGRGALLRAVLATAGLPLAIAAVGIALVLSWRDELPAPVATHWSLDGTADGFSSVTTVGWILGVFAAVFAVTGVVLLLAGRAESTIVRTVAGTTAGTTAFVTVLMVGLTERQRGLADAATAPLSALVMLAATAAGVAVALLAAALVPRWHSEPGPAPADGPRLDVGPGERVVWTRSVATGGAPAVIVVAGIGVTAVIAAATQLWWLLVLSLALALVALAMFAITVTVDRRGLAVRGRLGWPRSHTPLDQIVAASTVTVNPLRDFGGWGYRIAAFGPLQGARGYVLRAGDAILVQGADGSRLVVTVDDAATGAGLLNALVEPRR